METEAVTLDVRDHGTQKWGQSRHLSDGGLSHLTPQVKCDGEQAYRGQQVPRV